MRTLLGTFQRLMRKAQVAIGSPIVAVAIQTRPDGQITGAYAIEGANADEVEFAAGTILEAVVNWTAEADPSCPCCADRMARFKAAIAALQAKPAEPIISLH